MQATHTILLHNQTKYHSKRKKKKLNKTSIKQFFISRSKSNITSILNAGFDLNESVFSKYSFGIVGIHLRIWASCQAILWSWVKDCSWSVEFLSC